VDRSIVFLASADSHLATVLPGSVVAFEADHLDEAAGTGWAVVVTGMAEVVRERPALARLDGLRRASWAGDDRPTYVQVEPGLVTGLRTASIEYSAHHTRVAR
jgi:hypothetical protein